MSINQLKRFVADYEMISGRRIPVLMAPATNRRVAVVGGPARRLLIPDGRHKDRLYVGSDPEAFERLIVPSARPKPANAWYRLGKPTLLGPQFGVRPHWGRVDRGEYL